MGKAIVFRLSKWFGVNFTDVLLDLTPQTRGKLPFKL